MSNFADTAQLIINDRQRLLHNLGHAFHQFVVNTRSIEQKIRTYLQNGEAAFSMESAPENEVKRKYMVKADMLVNRLTALKMAEDHVISFLRHTGQSDEIPKGKHPSKGGYSFISVNVDTFSDSHSTAASERYIKACLHDVDNCMYSCFHEHLLVSLNAEGEALNSLALDVTSDAFAAEPESDQKRKVFVTKDKLHYDKAFVRATKVYLWTLFADIVVEHVARTELRLDNDGSSNESAQYFARQNPAFDAALGASYNTGGLSNAGETTVEVNSEVLYIDSERVAHAAIVLTKTVNGEMDEEGNGYLFSIRLLKTGEVREGVTRSELLLS